jgi:hypothetical protein
MSALPFYVAGAYPFESAYGMVLNWAIFNGLPVHKLCRVVGSADSTRGFYNYQKNFSGCDMPLSRANEPGDHFPSSFLGTMHASRYCVDCAKIGYHSVFCSIPQASACLIHARDFKDLCDTCAKLDIDTSKIGRTGFKCSNCGFCIPVVLEQISFRQDLQLRYLLFKYGNIQKKWCKSVYDGSMRGEYLCKRILNLTKDSFDEDLSMAVMSITGVANPFHPTPLLERKPVQLHWWQSDYAGSVFPDNDSVNDWISGISSICNKIENSYLCSHEKCLGAVERIMSFSAGEKFVYPLCPVALAYLFFRARLSFHGGWDGYGDRASAMGFDYIANAARMNSWLLGCGEKFFIIFYLKVLGAIGRILDGGNSQYIGLGLVDGLFDELIKGYSEKEQCGVTFVRQFDFSRLECGDREVYRNILEAEHFLVRGFGERTYKILNSNTEVPPFAVLRV